MSKKLYLTLWSITGLGLLALLAMTIALAVKSGAQGGADDQTVSAYLSSEYPKIILLDEPDPRSIVASVQENGTRITVTDFSHRAGEDWFHVNVNEDSTGWVPGEYISLEAP